MDAGATTNQSTQYAQGVRAGDSAREVADRLPASDVYAGLDVERGFEFPLADFESVEFVADGHRGVMRWSTAEERGNAGFEIQYRPARAGADYVTVGFVAGAGSSADHHAYRFGINNIPGGEHEFRIKVSAKDGRYRFTRPVRITIGEDVPFALGAAAFDEETGTIYVPYSLRDTGIIRIVVVDEADRLLGTLVFGTQRGGTHVATLKRAALENAIDKGNVTGELTMWLHTENGSASRILRIR